MNYWLNNVIAKRVWMTECKNQNTPQDLQKPTPREAMNTVHYSLLYDGHSCFLRAMFGHSWHSQDIGSDGRVQCLCIPVHDVFGNQSLQHGVADSLWSVSEVPSSSHQTSIWKTLSENPVSGGRLELVVWRCSRLCPQWRGVTAHCPNMKQVAPCALWVHSGALYYPFIFWTHLSFANSFVLFTFWYVLLKQSLSM